jgi:hypothetical protein
MCLSRFSGEGGSVHVREKGQLITEAVEANEWRVAWRPPHDDEEGGEWATRGRGHVRSRGPQRSDVFTSETLQAARPPVEMHAGPDFAGSPDVVSADADLMAAAC